MDNKLEKAQDRFIERVGKLAESFGLNKFIAQLYAVLYLSDKPLSLDDMVMRLKGSKGNISLNIRELEKWGAVRNVWVKGSRKDYYEADLDIKKVFSNKLKTSVQKRIAEVSGIIDEFNGMVQSTDSELTEDEKRLAKIYQERLKKIEDLKALAVTALNFAEKFL